MDIVILENNINYLNIFKTIIENYILFCEYKCHLRLVTKSPVETIVFAQNNQTHDCLYFLDIDLINHLNGLTFAKKIREINPASKLVILTSQHGLGDLIFQYQIEALDCIFIEKKNYSYLKKRIEDAITNSLKRFVNCYKKDENYLFFRSNKQIHKVNVSDIMYFESSYKAHRVIAQLTSQQLMFYGNLRGILEKNVAFKKCHHSVIVNVNNIRSIDFKDRKLVFVNDSVCYGSVRYLKALKDHFVNNFFMDNLL